MYPVLGYSIVARPHLPVIRAVVLHLFHRLRPMSHQPVAASVIILASRKSVGIAMILSILFGPLGLLYASVLGGVVMFAVSLIVGVFTLGFGLLLTWPICVIWAVIAANGHNRKLTSQVATAAL
jgi:hypothetical protein